MDAPSVALKNIPQVMGRHRRTTEEWLKGLDHRSPHSSNMPALSLPFQRWFKFKEAFSPALILDCLRASQGEVRTSLDVFGGCGTTGVTSQFLGIKPTLVEVNPFIADLAEAKLIRYDRLALLDDFERVVTEVARLKAPKNRSLWKDLPSTFCEPGINDRYLFSKATLGKILAYREVIEALETSDHRRLLRVLLGSILVPVSNAVVNGKGRKYRRGWQTSQKSPEDVNRLFASAFTLAIDDLQRYTERAELNYSIHRSSCLSKGAHAAVHDVAICSPPYPNSFDYTDIYNIELWVLGYLKSAADNALLRRSTLQSHVQCTFSEGEYASQSPLLRRTVKKLQARRGDLWDQRIPEMVQGYFSDLHVLMDQMRRSLRKNGSAFFVVGDSRYADVSVRVAEIMAESAESLGYTVRDLKIVRKMRVSAQQGGRYGLNETVLHIRNRNPQLGARTSA